MESRPVFALDKNTTLYLRAIAIVAVIAGHIFGGSFGLISVDATSLLGNSGVTVFLLLSGYGLFASYKAKGISGKTYWSSKIRKIFLPYGVITLCDYLFLTATNRSPGLIVLAANLFCVDFTRQMDGSMWYMSFLLLWYLLFFFVFYFDYPDLAKVLLLLLFGALFKRYLFRELFADCAWQFANNAYSFPLGVGIGYLFSKVNLAAQKGPVRCPKPILEIPMALICLCLFLGGLFGMFAFTATQNGIFLFVIFYVLLSRVRPGFPVLQWLGEHAFLLYLLEGKWLRILLEVPFLKSRVPLFCAVYTASLILSVVIYQYAYKGITKRSQITAQEKHRQS